MLSCRRCPHGTDTINDIHDIMTFESNLRRTVAVSPLCTNFTPGDERPPSEAMHSDHARQPGALFTRGVQLPDGHEQFLPTDSVQPIPVHALESCATMLRERP